MKNSDPMVYVVDDDLAMRQAIQDLLASAGFRAVTFSAAAEYMAAEKLDGPACLILDVELPDINGLDLQRQLALAEHPPIVFITGYGDIPSSVRAMKAGAIDFLPKPFSDEALVSAVDSALLRDREARVVATELRQLRQRYESLTPRERDVLPLVVSGLRNKQAASVLGISEVTLQIHRGQIMRKMAAPSRSELVRMSTKLGIPVHTAATERGSGGANNEKSNPGSRQGGCHCNG